MAKLDRRLKGFGGLALILEQSFFQLIRFIGGLLGNLPKNWYMETKI